MRLIAEIHCDGNRFSSVCHGSNLSTALLIPAALSQTVESTKTLALLNDPGVHLGAPTFRGLDYQASLLDIRWSEVQDFADSHAAPGHQFQHWSIPGVCGTGNDLINRLLIHDIPLDSRGLLENLLDHGSVAGIGESGQACIDAEVVERSKY